MDNSGLRAGSASSRETPMLEGVALRIEELAQRLEAAECSLTNSRQRAGLPSMRAPSAGNDRAGGPVAPVPNGLLPRINDLLDRASRLTTDINAEADSFQRLA